MTKRKKALIDSPTSPSNPSIRDNYALTIIMAKLDIMGAQLMAQLAKSEQLESSITNLLADMAVGVNGQRQCQKR